MYSKVLRLLLLVSAAYLAVGEIRYNEIDMNETRTHLLDRFVFTKSGRLEVNITGLSFSGVPPQQVNLSKIGFILSPYGMFLTLFEYALVDYCPFEGDNLHNVLTFDQLPLPISEWNFVYSVNNSGPCTFLFRNCLEEIDLYMNVRSAMYNLEDDEQSRNYLASTTLPRVYYIFFFIYFALGVVWVIVLYTKRAFASSVHYLMLAVVLLTAVNMFCEGEDKSSVMRTGSGDAWELWFYTFSLLKGLFLYTLMHLISSGWKFLKPFLLKREKLVLIGVVGLQCVGNTVLAVGGKSGGYYGIDSYWAMAWGFANLASTIATIYSIKWSIKFLLASHTHRRDSFVLKNLKFFRDYMKVTVVFFFLSHTAAFFLENFLSLDALSIVVAGVEALTCVYYVYTACMFIPQPQELYLLEEEVEAAAREELALCLSVEGIESILP